MSKRHYGKQTGSPVTHEIPTPAGGVRLETFIGSATARLGIEET